METKTEKKCGHIRKWVAGTGWGIVNSYSVGGVLQKYFLHITAFLNTSATPSMGSRVLFVEGPARTEGELPVALEVEVISEVPAAEGGAN
jgi:hypothetical protein